jgi:hypothetical protein
MAFNQLQHTPYEPNQDASAPSTLMLQHLVQRARTPWTLRPFSAVTAAADSAAYHVAGRDTHVVIAYAPGTAPASFSLEVWGSFTNNPNSFSKLGTITALNVATTLTGPYAYLVFSLQSITTPGGGLTVEAASYLAS